MCIRDRAGDDVLPDADFQPVGDAVDVVVGPIDVLRCEELLEVGKDRVVDLEIFVDGAIGEVMRCLLYTSRCV